MSLTQRTNSTTLSNAIESSALTVNHRKIIDEFHKIFESKSNENEISKIKHNSNPFLQKWDPYVIFKMKSVFQNYAEIMKQNKKKYENVSESESTNNNNKTTTIDAHDLHGLLKLFGWCDYLSEKDITHLNRMLHDKIPLNELIPLLLTEFDAKQCDDTLKKSFKELSQNNANLKITGESISDMVKEMLPNTSKQQIDHFIRFIQSDKLTYSQKKDHWLFGDWKHLFNVNIGDIFLPETVTHLKPSLS